MKYLIPDTNVFVQDFRLEGNSFRAFLGNYTAVANRVLIPKVVYQENLNNYAKRLDGELKKLNDNYRNICRLVGEEIQKPEVKEIDALVKIYDRYLQTKLRLIDYEILDYPPVSLEVIAEKAIKRVIPFKKSGEGYCDAIIWETIVHILRTNEDSEVIFVTNNKKDFLNGDEIHDDLSAELVENDISPKRLKIHRTLKDVVDDLLLVHLDALDALKEQINTKTVPGFNIDDWISNQLFDLITVDDAGHILCDLTSDDCTMHLSEIYEVLSVRADEARVLNKNDKYITITARIGLSLDVCADYYQYEDNINLETLFNYWQTVPTPYDCVSASGEAEVKISVVIQGDELADGKVELMSLTGKHGTINYDVPRSNNA